MLNNLNTKKAAMWLAIVAIGSLALSAALFFNFGSSDLFGSPWLSINGKFTTDIDEKKSLEIADLKNLHLGSSSTDINIFATDDQIITAHLHGTISSSKEGHLPALVVKKTGDSGSISIEWPRILIMGFSNSNLKLDIYLPRTYTEKLNIESSSANLSFEELTVASFKATTSSGDLFGKNVSAGEIVLKSSSGNFEVSVNSTGSISLESTSGDFILDSVKGKTVTRRTSSGLTRIAEMESGDFTFNSSSGNLKIGSLNTVVSNLESSSGEIEVNGVSMEKVVVKTTSGDITWEGLVSKSTQTGTSSGKTVLSGTPGILNHKSSSGDIDIDFYTLTNNVKIETSSGHSTLKIPSETEFGINYSASSGRIKLKGFEATVNGSIEENNFKGYVGSNTNMIEILATSGDAEISKK